MSHQCDNVTLPGAIWPLTESVVDLHAPELPSECPQDNQTKNRGWLWTTLTLTGFKLSKSKFQNQLKPLSLGYEYRGSVLRPSAVKCLTGLGSSSVSNPDAESPSSLSRRTFYAAYSSSGKCITNTAFSSCPGPFIPSFPSTLGCSLFFYP